MSGDQISLLDPPAAADVVAPSPGRTRRTNPATSRQAAQSIAVKAGKLKHRILLHLRAQGAHGANDYELWQACDPKGRPHSAATRRGELEAAGLTRRTAITRPTDTPGNEGLVSVITEAGLDVLRKIEEARDAA